MASGVGTGAGLSTLRFQGMTESIAPMCSTLLTNLARIYRIPVGSGPGPEARRKETRLPIVATSSGRLFLDRVARQHCPSPLHRHHQLKIIAASKEMIYHRTVNSLLTVCLTHRDNSTPIHRTPTAIGCEAHSNHPGFHNQAAVDPNVSKPSSRIPIRTGQPSLVRSSRSPERWD